MRWLRTQEADFRVRWQQVLSRRREGLQEVMDHVGEILRRVKEEGDWAVRDYTFRFDGVQLAPQDFEIPRADWRRALAEADDALREALFKAREEIEAFCRLSLPRDWMEVRQGLLRGEIYRPVSRAGVYVPGGKASYPSSVLMGVIPAVVAGVKEIIVVTPPPAGPVIKAACEIAEATRLFQVGGPQAIAALAYGTERIPKVDVIVGPGNRFVTAAKKLLYGEVGIDMLAGPSELLVLSDGTTSPRKAALDLLSQAEHDEDAWAVLITTDPRYATDVHKEIEGLLPRWPRGEIARRALERNGLIVLARDLQEALDLCNEFAPEHLELHVRDPWEALGEVDSAGSVFLGEDTPVALGDYCGGPNHILPTQGAARFSSPLGVQQFLKRIQFLRTSGSSLKELCRVGAMLAEGEGLGGHALALRGRVEDEEG